MTTYDFDLADLGQATFQATVDQAIQAAQSPSAPAAPAAVVATKNPVVGWFQDLGMVPKVAIGTGLLVVLGCGAGYLFGGRA